MKYIAHVKFDKNGNAIEHWLEDHLHKVAKLSAKNAQIFGGEYWAKLAGRWHDLGKYSNDFQRYIKNVTGYEVDAHIETAPNRVNHSSAGALFATQQFKEKFNDTALSKIIAYLIAGHHAGLADWSSTSGHGSLQHRLQDSQLLADALANNPPESISRFDTPTSAYPEGSDASFWIRMLFSCLVDADFLDTESFMSPEKAQQRKQSTSLIELNKLLDQHLSQFSKKPVEGINRYRKQILDNCQQAANERSGLFSLTVPTGGGKTLSSLSFALRHAIKHKKDRIIYVIPYTSIIEQTADIFKEIFQAYPNAVLEHHSNFDPDEKKETAYLRLASENWDAPLIVTTSVQYFESLYANKTSRVRKLHNIANSVVILDEAQMLPPDYLTPVLKVIEELSKHYKVSHVLCTATQPALESHTKGVDKFNGLQRGSIKEIIEHPQALTEAFKRVDIIPLENKIDDWSELAELLMEHDSFLCIVDRRSDAQALYELLPTDTFHLSGLMCGQHRSDVIQQIKNDLKNNKPVRVVSTQLIEAGVDIDLPVVFRAMAGLDSIAQAAGHCNREGKLKENDASVKGKVYIFKPPKAAPAGHLRQAADIGESLLSQTNRDPLSNQAFTEYFKQLYWIKGEKLDKKSIIRDDVFYEDAQLRYQFKTAAKKFKLIESDYESILIPYGEGDKHIQTLRNTDPIYRELRRKLQRYSVNIQRDWFNELFNQDKLDECNGMWILIDHKMYHGVSGLRPIDDSMNYRAESLIG